MIDCNRRSGVRRLRRLIVSAAVLCAAVSPVRGSLTINLRYANGSTTDTISPGFTGNIPIQMWATVTGANPLGSSNFDGLEFVYYSLISSLPNGPGTAVTGGLASPVLVAPFNSIYGSQAGALQDLNGDGVTDLGSTANTSNSAFALAISSNPPALATWNDNTTATKNYVTDGVEFLVETVNYDVTASANGEATTINPYIPNFNGSSYVVSNWWKDNATKNQSIGTMTIAGGGTSVTLSVVGVTAASWINGSGGSWSTAGNWSSNSVPASGADAAFALNSSYGVTFSAPSAAGNINISAGNVTFNLSSQSLTGSGNLNIASNASLTVLGGLTTGNASAGQLGVLGTINVSGGTLTVTGALTAYNTAGSAIVLNGGSINAGSLSLGSAAEFNWSSGTLNLTNSSLTVGGGGPLGSSLTLGSSQALQISGSGQGLSVTGTINVSGGTTVNGNLAVGGGSGVCTLGGNGSMSAHYDDIGVGGAGTFNQSGGTNSATVVFVGNGGASGTYTLWNTGSLSCNELVIGFDSGNGAFNQSGGTNQVNQELDLGGAVGYTGTYILTGGTANVSGNAYVGGSSGGAAGTGVLNVSGGTLNVTGALTAYNTAGSAITLNGGTIDTGSLSLGSPSQFNWTSGTLDITNSYLIVDTGGPLGSTLALGTGQNLILAGGLSTGNLYVGNSSGGRVNQTGGSTNLGGGALYVGALSSASGAYALGPGATLSAGYEIVGQHGVGTFNQTGGVNTIGTDLDIAANAGSTGVFNISGGSTTVANNAWVGGYAGGAGGTGTLNISGAGSVTVTGTLRIYSGGTVNFTGGQLSANTINQSGGTFNASGTLALASTGQNAAAYYLSGGTSTIGVQLIVGDNGTGAYALSGSGSLSVPSEYVSLNGTGMFNQSGGTNTITSQLGIGVNPGYTGTYNLSGGSASVSGNAYVGGASGGAGGTGLLAVSGGTFGVSGMLTAYNTAGTAITLNGGTISTGSLSLASPSQFNWTSGTLNITGSQGLAIASGGPLGANVNLGSGMVLSLTGVGGNLVVGTASAGSGNLVVGSGATALVDASLEVGGGGQVTLNGGEIQTLWLSLPSPSQFNWTSGALIVLSQSLAVGNNQILGGQLTLPVGKSLTAGAGLTIDPTFAVNLQGGGLTIGTGATFSNLGTFNESSGVLTVNGTFANNSLATLGGTQNWGPGSVFVNLGGSAVFGSNLNASGSAPVVVITGGTVTFNGSAQLARLTDNAVAALAQSTGNGSRNILVTPSLSVTGKLDLGNGYMDVQGGSLPAITALVAAGYSGGTWSGTTGITSANAAGNTTHLTALGVIQNNQSGSALFTAPHPFDGVTPGAGDILIKYTYCGDANLDGKVDGSDYSRIDTAYLADKTNPTALTGWYNGDFNYDGLTNGSDYTLIDNAFNSQGAQLTALVATPEAVTTAEIAGATGSSAVPEPGMLGIMAAIGTVLLGRRRRDRAK